MFFKVLHVSRSNERGYLVNQNNLMLQKFDPRPKKNGPLNSLILF